MARKRTIVLPGGVRVVAYDARRYRDLIAYRRVRALGWTYAAAARAAGVTERHLHRRFKEIDEAMRTPSA